MTQVTENQRSEDLRRCCDALQEQVVERPKSAARVAGPLD